MRRLLTVTIAAVILAGCSKPQEPAKQIPLKDFFRNPEQTYFQLSPDGKYIAMTMPYEKRMNIHVQAVGSKDITRLTAVTDRDISQYFWKGNDRLLFIKDFGGDENFHLFAVDREGKESKDLTPFEGARVELVDDLRDHDTDVLISTNQRKKEIFDVYRLNTVTGEMKMVAENPGNVTAWVTDHTGMLRIAVTTDGVNSSILYREDDTKPFKSILTTTFKDQFAPLFFTFDNKNLYAASNLGRDKVAIVTFDLATAKETGVLFEHADNDVESMSYSRLRKVLTEIHYTTWKPERKVLDPETEQMYSFLKGKLADMEIYLTSSNKAEDVYIVRTVSDRSLGSFYIYDKTKNTLDKIADRAPWLNADDLVEMKPIEYTSRDGLKIHGYLTLPKGVDPKKLPVVVHPHGGPWARDVWGFNSEVQFLANRGFAVLQMNFRGSTGYGREFWTKSFKQWGRTMQNDISDGVKYLTDEGIADPKRIAIYGGSYGGYATLAGITLTPELYACAVDYVGVSNMFTFMKTIPPYWKPYLDQFYEMVGDPVKDSVMLAEVSPVFHVDKIKAPLFIAQGAKDPRVNVDESDQVVKALKQRGVEVEYLVKANEGHGFHNEENRMEFYGAMEKFLAKHLVPKN